MYIEFPEVFQYLLGIFNVNDIEAMNFKLIRDYLEFYHINVLAYISGMICYMRNLKKNILCKMQIRVKI